MFFLSPAAVVTLDLHVSLTSGPSSKLMKEQTGSSSLKSTAQKHISRYGDNNQSFVGYLPLKKGSSIFEKKIIFWRFTAPPMVFTVGNNKMIREEWFQKNMKVKGFIVLAIDFQICK